MFYSFPTANARCATCVSPLTVALFAGPSRLANPDLGNNKSMQGLAGKSSVCLLCSVAALQFVGVTSTFGANKCILLNHTIVGLKKFSVSLALVKIDCDNGKARFMYTVDRYLCAQSPGVYRITLRL